eukprot:scaffold1184_cov132-Cylindrotheca_fusiformis.AAC.37
MVENTDKPRFHIAIDFRQSQGGRLAKYARPPAMPPAYRTTASTGIHGLSTILSRRGTGS